MATRMQQRRGTAAEWTTANPVLAAGEIGYETDTGKFKFGDGVNTWDSIQHFADATALIGAAPETLDTLGELAAAIGDDPAFYQDVADNQTNIATLQTTVSDVVTQVTALQNADSTIQSDISTLQTDLTDLNTQLNLADAQTLADAKSYTDDELGLQIGALEVADATLQDNINAANLLIAQNTSDIETNYTALDAAISANSVAITQESSDRAAAITVHSNETLNVHGIADTSVLATSDDVSSAQTAAETFATTAVTSHNDATTNVHGIADTSVLATDTDLSNAVSAHNADTTNVHGIADTAALATNTDVSDAQTAAQGFATTAVSNHNAETTNVHGIADTSLLVTTAGATLTGKLTLDGDPTQALHAVTKQYVDSAEAGLSTKPQVVAASTGNIAGTYDNGTDGVGATLNLGQLATLDIDGATSWSLLDGILLKDQTTPAENGRWVVEQIGNDTDTDWILRRCSLCDTADEIPGAYIFVVDGATNEQTGWVLHVENPATFTVGTDDIDAYQFAGAGSITAGTNISVNGKEVSLVADPTLTDATVTNLDATNITFADGTVQTKAGVPSLTTFSEKTASYTLDTIDHQDNVVEMNSTGGMTFTIPTDANLSWPIGASMDVIQTNTGQITITGDSGVTVNATPGLTTREQWSSATLMKRAANTWIVYGDLQA